MAVRDEMHLVVPAGIDDPGSPSGGNTYDRRIRDGLRGLGWTVRQHPVAGAWPSPAPPAAAALTEVLDGLPDGATVLVDGLVGCGVPDVLVPRAGRLRLVVLVHLPLGDEVGAAPGLVEREGRVLHAARAVVVTSPWAARRLIELHALPPDHIQVIPPGVDPAPTSPAFGAGTGGGHRLLCVGALTPTKGQDVLIDALVRVRDREWTCRLVGPPRDARFTAELHRAIGRHRLDERVRLPGPLPARDCYPAADLLILPSRAETYGMVITEALARGIPVIAARAGGIPETLGRDEDGVRPGLLVPPADPEALASALRRWLDDGGLRAGLRAAVAGRQKTLDGWEVTARCLAKVLVRLR
jgi:glycosyltransferase involved in cell wall biosynthesis